MTVAMTPIESSHIEAVGYDAGGSKLHIKFKSGGAVYIHSNVDAEKHAAFMASKSKGSHYHSTFRGNAAHPVEILKPEA